MKRFFTILITVFVCIISTLHAQNRELLYQQSFDENSMPAGFQVMGDGQTNWIVVNTVDAGGDPNELKFKYSPTFTGLSRMVLPPIDLTGMEQVLFRFKHDVDHYSSQYKIGIATSSDNGVTWHDAWTKTVNSNIHELFSKVLSSEDMGKDNVRFCFYFEGNTYSINYWSIDDIEILSLENKDIAVSNIEMPDLLRFQDYDVKFSITNFGIETINSIKANYKINGELITTQEFTGLSVEAGNSYNFTFNESFTVEFPIIHNIEVEVTEINGSNDDVEENNKLQYVGNVLLCTTERTPIIEVFTSSTCPPCNGQNSYLDNMLNSYQGDYSIVKYQMNWPGSGDPYYTAEGGVRRVFYGVSGVPTGVLDAYVIPSTMGLQYITHQKLDDAAQVPAEVDIAGTYTIEGYNINVEVDVATYANMPNAKVLVVVTERKTTGNVGSNGEKEFHHVMMKMIPDAYGSEVNVPGGHNKHFSFTQDMSNTNVEEMDDLDVVVFVQHQYSGDIYNSKTLYNHNKLLLPPDNLIITNNQDNTATISWTKPLNAEPISYTVYLNDEIVAADITDLNYTVDVEDGNLYVYAVRANYPNVMKSVKIADYIILGQETLLPVENLESPEDYKIQWDAPMGQTPLHYNIHVNGELIDNTTDTYYIFNQKRNMLDRDAEVCVTAKYSEGESEPACITVTWLNINDVANNVEIYPNPVKDKLYIKGQNIERLYLMNSIGKVVKELKYSEYVDITDLSAGLYTLKIILKDQTVKIEKIIVMD